MKLHHRTNVNEAHAEAMTFGQKVADKVASIMGSWNFIIIQSLVLLVWALLNSVGWWLWKWDIYPFIAMNLLLSCQAAYASPLILMSQNRQADKDRIAAAVDYEVNRQAELHTENILTHLDQQDEKILAILQRVEVLDTRILQLAQPKDEPLDVQQKGESGLS